MASGNEKKQLEEVGLEIFELTKIVSVARAQARPKDIEMLTETESVTLDLLSKAETMTVGEIQKQIGVLPAQMSRIVRSLEDKGGDAYIACSINPDDRRRIDVSITKEGQRSLDAYRNARLGFTIKLMESLTPDERESFMQILRKMRKHVQSLLKQPKGSK